MMGSVVAVSARVGHHFSKTPSLSIRLLRGLGVAGDAHIGETVKHRSRVRRDPTAPNLRQVHLIHAELFSELRGKGFAGGAFTQRLRSAHYGNNIPLKKSLLPLAYPRSATGPLLCMGLFSIFLLGARTGSIRVDAPGTIRSPITTEW